MKELVTKIDVYRQKHGLKQDELAEMVGVRRETIGRLEKGQYNPSLKLAWDIAEVFKAPIESVFQYVEVEDELTRRANMVYNDRVNAEEFELLIRTIIDQTKSGKAVWDCTEYNPVGILVPDILDDDGEPTVSHFFVGEAIVGQRQAFVTLIESINLTNNKANLSGDICLDVADGTAKQEFSLNYSAKYDKLTAEGVCSEFSSHIVAELFNTLIPIFVQSDMIRESLEWASFFPCGTLPAKYKRMPLVKLSQTLLEEGRIEDFHRIIMDMDYRAALLRKI